MDELTSVDLFFQAAAMIAGLFGIWAGFKARLAVLEAEVTSIKSAIEELRSDIKSMLSSGCNIVVSHDK